MQYIKKVKGQTIENEALPFGKAVHEDIEKKIYGHNITEQICKKFYVASTRWPHFEDFLDAVTNLSSRAINALKNPFFKSGESSTEYRFAINKENEPIYYDSPNAYIRGIIDFIHVVGDTVHIIDWKTGKGEGNIFQLQFYSYVLSKIFPKKKIIGEFFYLESDEREEKVIDLNCIYCYKNKIDKSIEEIEKETEWPKTKNQYCFFCSYYNTCTTDEKKEKIESISSFLHPILQ